MKLENQNLQNLIKRDPESYKDEFLTQWRSFEASLLILQTSPAAENEEFMVLVKFLSHVIPCYIKPKKENSFAASMPSEISKFHETLMELLEKHALQMHPEVRRAAVQALILLRNRNQIEAVIFLKFLFGLFKCSDKLLRTLIHSHIISDIKNENAKSKNNKLNKSLQNFMYTMLADANENAAKRSLMVMTELYKKNVWNDAKTVNVIADACFSKNFKLMTTALHFFLGANEEEEKEDSDDEMPDLTNVRHLIHINKKKKSRKSQLEKVMTTIKKKSKSKGNNQNGFFSALQLINDPQGFTEKLFVRLRQASSLSIKYEVRILMLNLISRVIHVHSLIILPLYEYVLSFLKPSQRDVTAILAYTAQACHHLVPPDAVEPVVQTIADNFIWSNCANEVVVAGLNSLREICARCPLAMSQTLIQSLVEDYKHHREKGVMMAIRSLIGLFREVYPELLQKKDRGRAVAVSGHNVVPQYGQVRVMDTIEGLDVLESRMKKTAELAEQHAGENDEEVPELEGDEEDCDPGEGWEGWELASMSGEEADNVDEQEGDEEQEEDSETVDTNDKKPDHDKSVTTSRSLATEKIFTDEDFKKLRILKARSEAERIMGVKKNNRTANKSLNEDEEDHMIHFSENDGISENEEEEENSSDEGRPGFLQPEAMLQGLKRKRDYEARMESIKAGREGREKFGSMKNKKDKKSSTTNREKAKTKAFMMIKHKRSVKGKAKRSLREQQRVLREHIRKQKMKM